MRGGMRRSAFRARLAARHARSVFALTDVRPHHLSDADERENRTVYRPMVVAYHEANAEGEVEALKDPDCPAENHQKTQQAADDAHHHIKCFPHTSASYEMNQR